MHCPCSGVWPLRKLQSRAWQCPSSVSQQPRLPFSRQLLNDVLYYWLKAWNLTILGSKVNRTLSQSEQESRIVARKPRNTAAVLSALRFVDNIHSKFRSSQASKDFYPVDDHIAISGCPAMSHLFVDTFFEFGVVENFVFRARITVILTSNSFGSMNLWLWLCALDDDLLLLPVFSVILKMYKVPFFILLPSHLTICSL